MGDSIVVVRCPRCGSMDAESVEDIGIEFDRMKCGSCGYSAICDLEQIKGEWNEEVDDGELARVRWHVLPSIRFHELWVALGASGYSAPAFTVLRAAYDEPHRAYHDARHIGACLRLLDDREVRALAEHPAEVEAALFYHDVVYDTHARDNEERSAALAERALRDANVAADVVARIGEHVRATKEHTPETYRADGKLVIDIDLSILGEAPETYARFEEDIRREYAWVEPAAYVTGRSSVLRKFLDRESIYNTPLFRERYEARARDNIGRSLAALAKSS